MLKKMMKRLKKEEKGFTLIELLAVIVILAVIAVIAVPLIGKIIDNTKKDADVATAQQIYDAARLYITGENSGVIADVNIADLISKGYLSDTTVLPSTKADITGGTVDFTGDVLTKVSIVTGTGTTTTKDILAENIKLGKATR